MSDFDFAPVAKRISDMVAQEGSTTDLSHDAEWRRPAGIIGSYQPAVTSVPAEAEAAKYQVALQQRDSLGNRVDCRYDEALAQKATKPKPHLLTTEMRNAALPAVEYGANKYRPWGWLDNPMQWTDLLNATQRHLDAWTEGEENDPESGLCHLHHIAANVGFLLTYKNRELGTDDRRVA